MSEEAALSRRMLARTAADDEHARAYLQKRLQVFARVVFWAFVTLRVLEVANYVTSPALKPALYSWIFCTGIIGLAAMALSWRGLLVRRTLSVRVLAALDLAYTASSGLVFGASAILAYDRHEWAYAGLVYACFVVFTRMLVVPSTARWTANVTTITFLPLVITAGVLALTTDQGIPGPAYFMCATIYCITAIAIATAGSRFIYGLRLRVRSQARLGQYTLEKQLGEGATGTVYRARHAFLRRPTALKLLRIDPRTIDRIEQHVQRMSELTHPNTVAIFDYGHNLDGVFYYAMEYLDGIDLETLVRDHGPQPPGRVVDILVQICGALHEAHRRSIVHRDIKPASIILCERGGSPDVAKLGDFGLAADDRDAAADVRALAAVGRRLLGPASLSVLDAPPADAVAFARALQAARPADWDPDAARAWWRAFRTGERDAVGSMPRIHVTVDVLRRSA